MHVFKHPKYYKELRKRNKSDQVISSSPRDGVVERALGPGHKLDVPAPAGPSVKPQASSAKLQASSKPEPVQVQASSAKRQASQPE